MSASSARLFFSMSSSFFPAAVIALMYFDLAETMLFLMSLELIFGFCGLTNLTSSEWLSSD